MMEICSKERCTGCGACAYVCPKKCIHSIQNQNGSITFKINTEECVQCGRCKKICPQCEKVTLRDNIKAYAAWSNNIETRRTSASGGIAAELYQLALEKKMKIAGAVSNKDFSVELKLDSSSEAITRYKNSKYVFSTAYRLYDELEHCIKANEKAIVIALPCQIAAIRKIFADSPNLLLCDVVCHGTTPVSYLQQHISMLEKSIGKRADRMSFRDPDSHTYTHTFTLYSNDNRIYAKRMAQGDTYQIGYHKLISYRENCYHCIYAQAKRCSDITLSDYKGLGKLTPCNYDEKQVSCILVHTQKGLEWIDELIKENIIFAEERPIQEPISSDPQLQHPSVKSRARLDFEKQIVLSNGDFENAMATVIKHDNIRIAIRRILRPISKIKHILR